MKYTAADVRWWLVTRINAWIDRGVHWWQTRVNEGRG